MKSSCCGAPVALMPTNELIVGKTYWYACLKCQHACDVACERILTNKKCIACSEPLTSNERNLNMNYHIKCASKVIEQAWQLLNKENENESNDK